MIYKFIKNLKNIRFNFFNEFGNNYSIIPEINTEKYNCLVNKELYSDAPDDYIENMYLYQFLDEIKKHLKDIKENECILITPVKEKNINKNETKYTIEISEITLRKGGYK